MRTDVETCLKEIARWFYNHKSSITSDELHAILVRNCSNEAEVSRFTTFLGTAVGKLQFRKHLEACKVRYVETATGSIITEESWEKEKTGMIRRGERVPPVKYIEKKPPVEPSNLREPKIESLSESITRISDILNSDKNKLNEMDAQITINREKTRGLPISHPDWQKFAMSLKERDELKKSINRTSEFLQQLKRQLNGQQPSNLRESTFEDIESCQLVPDRYRDLLPLLDTYPAGSFLIEQSAPAGNEKIDMILQKLKDGVNAIQDSSIFRDYLLTMGKFWSYSIGNIMLIYLQKRDATRVAGFTTWKELGRYVKTGEKGIMILAPCLPPKGGYVTWVKGNQVYSVRYIEGKWYAYDTITKKGAGGPFNTKGEAEYNLRTQGFKEEKEEASSYESPRYFKVVYVFDVSQTTGKELPEIATPVLTGAANPELWDKMLALLKKKGVEVSFDPRPDQDPQIKGQFMMPNSIWVRPEESQAQQLKSLIHETGHYYTEGVFHIGRADAETIAESTAFVVGAHFGFDSGSRSFPYVAVWSQDKKVLDKNLAAIKNISSAIMTDMGA